MKILVMGLPGAGKTHFAERVSKALEYAWYNADTVRKMANDWDFSVEGRVRQAERMKTFADFEASYGRAVICDFVCPTEETRKQFNADLTVWINTIKEGRFENTNKLFVAPTKVDIEIVDKLSDEEIYKVAEGIESRRLK